MRCTEIKTRLYIFPLLLLILPLALPGCCHKEEPLITNGLDRLNWSVTNFTAMNRLISDYGTGGKYYNAVRPPYAVLDWDQTCAHFDVEEALMRFQLTNLRFKLSPEQFRGLLKDEINGVNRLSADYNDILLADIDADLISDFDFICRNYSGTDGTMSLEAVQPWYRCFHRFGKF